MNDEKNLRAELFEQLGNFDEGMLVTRGVATCTARPMRFAHVDSEAGTIHFVTSTMAGKVVELVRDPQVCVTMQSVRRWVSLNGHARPVDDRELVKKLWNPAWKAWFPEGPDDPSLQLIEVTISSGEYWDNTGTKMIFTLYDLGRAIATGTTPAVDDSARHASVTLN